MTRPPSASRPARSSVDPVEVSEFGWRHLCTSCGEHFGRGRLELVYGDPCPTCGADDLRRVAMRQVITRDPGLLRFLLRGERVEWHWEDRLGNVYGSKPPVHPASLGPG